MSSAQAGSGASFVERHGLWTDQQFEAAQHADRLIKEKGLEVVRISFADQHGILRGKTLLASEAPRALRNGCSITTTLLAKDTAHKTVFPVFTPGGGFGMAEMQGGGDFFMVPDPTTFRILPWAANTGWVLSDLYFADGTPVPFSTRRLLQHVLGRLGDAGFDLISGLEVEFHLFKLEDARLRPDECGWPGEPPDVTMIAQGYQYLTEVRYDRLEPLIEVIRRELLALGLPLRSTELELGPSQCEFTFHPEMGLASADTMTLFRSAVKQICRRRGYHASFMCRPKIAHTMSSGWHLHQSLAPSGSPVNAFAAADGLSPVGRQYLAGLLANAAAAAAFSTPTVNGYRRYRPYSLAPDRANWGHDNRGVMIRVIGGRTGDSATRLENRVGEPAANPYLYIASQVAAGLDGIARALDPGPSADAPYDVAAPALPKSLAEALAALKGNACFREAFGDAFIGYFVQIKEAEIARFDAEVTDWEQREYFDLF